MCPNEQNISLLWSFQVLCDAGSITFGPFGTGDQEID
jgi:hypothetical protein